MGAKRPKISKIERDIDDLIALDRATCPIKPREHWNGRPKRLTMAQWLELKAVEIQNQIKNTN